MSYNHRIQGFFLSFLFKQSLLKFQVPVGLKCLVVAGLSGVPQCTCREGERGRYG